MMSNSCGSCYRIFRIEMLESVSELSYGYENGVQCLVAAKYKQSECRLFRA